MTKTAVEKQYPDIDLQLMMAPDDMNAWHDELSVWITARIPTVDLIGLDSSWVSEFGAAGWAVPLNDKMPDLANSFEQSGLNVWSYNGKQLAVPFWGATNGLLITGPTCSRTPRGTRPADLGRTWWPTSRRCRPRTPRWKADHSPRQV